MDRMVPREHRRTSALQEKLQLLRSITHSHALNKTAIIVDASKYIEGLTRKMERLNRDIEEFAESSTEESPLPVVTVENIERGFLINVFSDKSCPGLLVSILEAFEELGLDVMEARVSCTDSFRLQAQAAGGESEEQGEMIGCQEVKQAVAQAIKKWSEGSDD